MMLPITSVLSSLSAEELQSAVINGQIKIIQSVKGIGGKTAERIILELKDKFKKPIWMGYKKILSDGVNFALNKLYMRSGKI